MEWLSTVDLFVTRTVENFRNERNHIIWVVYDQSSVPEVREVSRSFDLLPGELQRPDMHIENGENEKFLKYLKIFIFSRTY